MARAAEKAVAARHGRKPVWQEVEEQEGRRLRTRASRANRRRRQLAIVYDIEGPKVRLGVGWFLLLCASLYLGRYAVAATYAVVAGLAGAQTAKAWRRRKGNEPHVAAAAVAAAALPLAAALSTAALGLAVLAGVALSVLTAGASKRPLGAAARTIQCWFWVGGGAAGLLCAHRVEPSSAVALVLVVSAYEIGDFLVGSGARNSLEGPIAGGAAVLVVQFGVATLGLEPFDIGNGLGFAALAAVLCPLGQLAGSLVLPSVKAKAPALRRLDSLLLLGPAWAFLVGLAAQAQP